MPGLSTGVLKRLMPVTLALGLLVPGTGAGDDKEPVPVPARQALDLVWDAARAWQPDAALIYLENDEELTADGMSGRWGYLFYSPTRDKARSYSVKDGEIVFAEFLQFKFEAPPLSKTWIDSNTALAAADEKSKKFREELGGRASTLLLIRGGFDEKKPDLTTWTVVYTAPGVPALFVVVDAVTGKVERKWRG